MFFLSQPPSGAEVNYSLYRTVLHLKVFVVGRMRGKSRTYRLLSVDFVMKKLIMAYVKLKTLATLHIVETPTKVRVRKRKKESRIERLRKKRCDAMMRPSQKLFKFFFLVFFCRRVLSYYCYYTSSKLLEASSLFTVSRYKIYQIKGPV